MPIAPPSPASPAPAAPGAAAPPGQPSGGSPPFGSSPATQPTQNLGHVAMGMTKLALVVQQLGDIVPLVGAASETGQAVVEAIRKLAKHVQPGSATDADKTNQMKQMMARQTQMAPQLAALRAQGTQQPQPGQPAGPQPAPQQAA